jgi:HEAT repeat protein
MSQQTAFIKRVLLPIGVLAIAVFTVFAAGTLFSKAAQPSTAKALAPSNSGLHSSNAAERASAVKALRDSHDPAAAPALLAMLNDPDQAVGLYVAQALGDITPANLLPRLRAALNDKNVNVRWRAAMALGSLNDKEAVPGLTVALRDADPQVQGSAAGALAQIGTPAAVTALGAGLDSSQPSVVQASMAGLESLREQAVPALSQALLNSPKAEVRQDAANVLGYIASPQSRTALQLASVDPDPAVRSEVQWALSQLSE